MRRASWLVIAVAAWVGATSAPAGAQSAFVGPCAEDSSTRDRWVASAALAAADRATVACAELDLVPGPDMLVVERDGEGGIEAWTVLRSDPDRVRIVYARRPEGLEGVAVKDGQVVEETRSRRGTRYSHFASEPGGGGFRLVERRHRGRIIDSRRIRLGRSAIPRIASFELADASLDRARRRFGSPLRYLRRGRSLCEIRFRRGITVTAATLGFPYPTRCSRRLSVTRVRVSATGWHTSRDLAIGDSRDRIADLYPGAEPSEDLDGQRDENRMILHRKDYAGLFTVPTVEAILSDDRVIAFEMGWPNAGE